MTTERRTLHQARAELLDLVGHGMGTAGEQAARDLVAEIELLTRRDERRQLAAVLRLRRRPWGRGGLRPATVDALIAELTADDEDLAAGDHFAGMPQTKPTTTVTAIFDRLDGSGPYEREVKLELVGEYVYLRGGPTGYESAPADGLANNANRDWAACFGTKGSWARCIVPSAQLRAGLTRLGIAVPV